MSLTPGALFAFSPAGDLASPRVSLAELTFALPKARRSQVGVKELPTPRNTMLKPQNTEHSYL